MYYDLKNRKRNKEGNQEQKLDAAQMLATLFDEKPTREPFDEVNFV